MLLHGAGSGLGGVLPAIPAAAEPVVFRRQVKQFAGTVPYPDLASGWIEQAAVQVFPPDAES